MDTSAFFIGRDREVAQLDLSIGSGTDGLRLAMLSGPSGLGKTTLSNVTMTRAAERGYRVATVKGRAGSLSTPFAPFMQAMPEFEVLLAVLAGDQHVDLEHAGIGLVNLLAELTITQPLLLVFDDAQALDESSIALLPYLVGVSERMNLTLLFVEQTDAVGVPSTYRAFIDGLLARRVVGHLELGPMAEDAVRQLVAHELGLEDSAAVPGEVVIRAQGNPWFAKELAHAYERGDSEIPTNIAAAATARLHGLDEVGQDVVTAISLCPEGAHVGWLEALAEQRPRQFVRTMEAIQQSGLVREDEEILTIAHPLMQQALIDELSAAMRRAIHLELADVISEVPMAEVVSARARGFHLAAGGKTDEAVADYLRAADGNEIAGQLHEAYKDLRMALAAEPRIDGRIELIRRTAAMAMQIARDQAEPLWVELGRIAAGNDDDELYAYALFQQYWTSNDGTARDRLERAANLGADRYGWSARAAANLASLEGNWQLAAELDERAVAMARERDDEILEVLALHRRGVALSVVGELDLAISLLREAIGRCIKARQHAWAVTAWGDLAATLTEDLRVSEGLAECESALRYVDDMGLDRYRATVLAWKSNVLVRLGDLESARASAALAQSLAPNMGSDAFLAHVAMQWAEVLAEHGDSEADGAIAYAWTLVDMLGFESWAWSLSVVEARAAVRSGNIADIISRLEPVAESDEPHTMALAATILVRLAALHGSADALAAARMHVKSIGDSSAKACILAVDEVQATAIAIEQGDVSDLEGISRRYADADMVLESARVLMSYGSILAANGKRDEAVTCLKQVRQTLATCGSSADADMVAAKLRELGTRSRAKSRQTKVGPLTKRELEIARLVATGLKNSEVAASLFLAEKTVAAHLSNIYGKVEVRSRVQLTAWIREHDVEFEATLAS